MLVTLHHHQDYYSSESISQHYTSHLDCSKSIFIHITMKSFLYQLTIAAEIFIVFPTTISINWMFYSFAFDHFLYMCRETAKSISEIVRDRSPVNAIAVLNIIPFAYRKFLHDLFVHQICISCLYLIH